MDKRILAQILTLVASYKLPEVRAAGEVEQDKLPDPVLLDPVLEEIDFEATKPTVDQDRGRHYIFDRPGGTHGSSRRKKARRGRR